MFVFQNIQETALESSKGNNSDFEKYILDNLDRALEEEWIKAYHQPLIRAANGRVSDEEAFARWETPDGDIYPASLFVPILDKHNLTYKLDLYMVNRVLEKLKSQASHDLFIVPESVNLSGTDFKCCDMVSEIIKLVDKSGLSREKLCIELSEKDISSDMDYYKDIIDRFRSAGIKVWMDNYGSGYASLLILLKIHFDLLKINDAFTHLIGKDEAGQILLTEVVKTALSLGTDTVAEGIETKEQADFLTEIGCTKLQGFYYVHPVSLSDIVERNEKGIQIGFENPEESSYFEQVGKINLYDLSLSQNDDKPLSDYFDATPMVIFSIGKDKATFVRCNKSFRNFILKKFPEFKEINEIDYSSINPGVGYYSFNAARQCAADGRRVIIDDRMNDGRIVQLLMFRIAVNPVTGDAAVATVILSVSDPDSKDSLTYNYIARALSEDYITLFFVDLDNDSFTEYSSHGESRDISFERKGSYFFDLDKDDFDPPIIEEDKEQFKKLFTKEIVASELEKNGVYSVVTRMLIKGVPTFVTVKAVKVKGKGNHVIIGINNVDNQIKAREVLEHAKEEEIIYSRIGALSGNYIYIFSVDPVTGHYKKYIPTNKRVASELPEEGDDFFGDMIKITPKIAYPDDVDDILSAFTKKKVMKHVRSAGVFEHRHRLLYGDSFIYVAMRAVMDKKGGDEKLVVGVLDIDEVVRREQEYNENLYAAESKAIIDELTGIKNKHAYAETELMMNEMISDGTIEDFALAVFDLNGLKQINDTLGHQAGDEYIRKGCSTICSFFKRSPVFRIGGDEFVAIIQGPDYLNCSAIMTNFKKHNIKNQYKGDVVVAAGLSKYTKGDKTLSQIFERADKEMYKNKNEIKQLNK
ncbi:MAG: GGDEF domain-containing protein [Butyrivibrio sp.]|nr:GGDEF domain-containing protein [Butyrivibrio sp.]